MNKLYIPNPCPRRSQSMDKVNHGFYCDDCCKIVIDFRDKTNAEILAVIKSSREEPCGIFRSSQLKPGKSFSDQIIRFAAALLLVFGSVLFQSCGDNEVVGKLCDTSAQGRYADSLARMYTDSVLKADSIVALDSAK